MQVSSTPLSTPAPAEWITGEAWFSTLKSPNDFTRTRIDKVHFAPGARTVWHRHTLGQVLVVTDGIGLVQPRGGPTEIVRDGDTVQVAPDEWHWHGATSTTAMTHLAVEDIPSDGNNAVAGAAVTDAEYLRQTVAETAESTTPVVRSVVLDQPLRTPHGVDRVEIRRITIAAGHSSGLHVHNCSVVGSVESGSAVYQIDGGPPTVLSPGDVFYEPKDAHILRFDAQDRGVTFLGYFLLDAGQVPEIDVPRS